MTTDTEALVRRAYHFAQGDVLDVQGFIDLFAEDGVFNGIGGVSGQESYRGERLGDVVVWTGKLLPDVHRELHRVNVFGDGVAIELSIRGTFLGPFETSAGVIQPTGAKLDIPTADFWYVRDGKIQVFNCHVGTTTMFAQLGILPDFASAVAASAPERYARPTGCAAARQPRTSGRVAPGVDGLLSLCDPLDLDRVEAEHLHVRQPALSREPGQKAVALGKDCQLPLKLDSGGVDEGSGPPGRRDGRPH